MSDPEKSRHARQICCIRLSALGDCINAFGVMQAVMRQHSDADVLWITDRRFAPLFTDDQGRDIVPMLRTDFKRGLVSAVRDLRSQLSEKGFGRFDALLDMQTSVKASLCSLCVRSDLKIGYDRERSREMQRLFVNRTIRPSEDPHVISGFLRFAEAAGLAVEAPEWDFRLDPFLIEKARDLTHHERRILVVNPCSAKRSKNWTLEGYCAVIQEARRLGMSAVLTGGAGAFETSFCEAVQNRCPGVINLCGKTDLRTLAAVLKISSLLVSPDSAPMHLASALNTPVIGLFAVHDERRVGPWNFSELNVSVYARLAAEELKGAEIPWRYRVRRADAMRQITQDMVLEKLHFALRSERRERASTLLR